LAPFIIFFEFGSSLISKIKKASQFVNLSIGEYIAVEFNVCGIDAPEFRGFPALLYSGEK